MAGYRALTAALVIWTLLSSGYLAYEVFLHNRICVPHFAVPKAGSLETFQPPTQAEINAQIEACSAPHPNLPVIGTGYLVILVPGLYMTARKRDISADP